MNLSSQLTVFLFLFTASAQAQDETRTWIPYDLSPGFVKFVNLNIDDQVSGRCWTNVATVEAKARLLLEQNDVQVIDYVPVFRNRFSPSVRVTVLGLRSENGVCFGNVEVDVVYASVDEIGGSEGRPQFRFGSLGVIFDTSSVFLNGNNMNTQVSDFVDGALSEFLADVLSARRDANTELFFQLYPGYADKPFTKEEWDKLISKN